MKKAEYQKRSLAVNKLTQYLEEFQDMPISQLLMILVSHIGEDNPYRWDDNTMIGKIEKNSIIVRQDYKLEWEEHVE